MPPVRLLLALLILALLANLAGGAQCVVRCADPVTPPPCHHHSPQKQSQPLHVCAAAMPLGESRAIAPVAQLPSIAETIPAPVLTQPAESPLYLRPATVRNHSRVFRI